MLSTLELHDMGNIFFYGKIQLSGLLRAPIGDSNYDLHEELQSKPIPKHFLKDPFEGPGALVWE
jgi:hypothetical protein